MDETFLALQRALAGEYSLEREIGRGGMGIVYLAREVQLDRLVAIKVLPRDLSERRDVRDRFVREARTAAGLSHPNIVPIHRVGEADGLPYFVMTYVRGTTLGERLRSRGPVTPTVLTRVVRDVALALGYAHGRGVIHRDVKPDNILLEEDSGRALVSDFGIARVQADADDEAVAGTVQFMSPEQARGEPLDGRADIYSLGVVAFLAATGHFPRESTTPPAVPEVLARAVERCLRLEPSERYRTGEEIASDLDASTAPARGAVPPIVRDWTSKPAPLLNIYGFWSGGWFIASTLQYIEWLRWLERQTVSYRSPLNNAMVGLALAALPLVPIAIFQLGKTRRALRAGYTIADLRAALKSWTSARREELQNAREADWARLLRAVPWSCAATASTALAMIDTSRNAFASPGLRTLVMGSVMVGIASLAALGALGLPLISPRVEARFAGRLRTRLWNSRFGAWLADLITPAERGVPETEFRPTELALQLAIDDLFAALPGAYREMIGELPVIASRLSAHVSELRAEVDRLGVVRGQARPDEEAAVDELLGGSRRQLAQTVGALERMRLELLRLHGGESDMRPLTTSLDVAREMVEDIVRLRRAEAEIGGGRRALPIDLRTPSPA